MASEASTNFSWQHCLHDNFHSLRPACSSVPTGTGAPGSFESESGHIQGNGVGAQALQQWPLPYCYDQGASWLKLRQNGFRITVKPSRKKLAARSRSPNMSWLIMLRSFLEKRLMTSKKVG